MTINNKINIHNKKSNFCKYLNTLSNKKIFFDPLQGNNGDKLILTGAKWSLKKSSCKLVAKPEVADFILLNGGGGMNDIWHFGLNQLEAYRTNYPNLPIIVGPSTYRFRGNQFKRICEINQTPLVFFTRDFISIEIIRNQCLADYIDIKPSQDLAFELDDSNFIINLRKAAKEKYILIAIRSDRESLSSGILSKVKGTWVPRKFRPSLSKVRDKLFSLRRRNIFNEILKKYGISKDIPIINQDVSLRVSFSKFISTIRDASFIITDRLHVGVLAHLLEKQTVLLPTSYGKTEGVYEMSMSEATSRTILFQDRRAKWITT